MNIKEKLSLPYIKVSGLEQVCNIPAGTIRLKSDKPIADKYIKAIEAEFAKLSKGCIGSSEPIIKEVIVEKIVYRDKPDNSPSLSNRNIIPVKKESTDTIIDIEGKSYIKVRITNDKEGYAMMCNSYPKGTTVYLVTLPHPEKRKTKTDGIHLYINDSKVDYEQFAKGFVLTELYNKIEAIKK